MRRLWTLNEIEQIAGVPLSKNDTFKKMWTLNEIKKIGGLDLEELDTSRRAWTKEELTYLLHDPYYIYALNIYKKSNLENIFTAAWEDMREVDGSEIERTSTSSTQYGTLQYPNGEDNGVIIPNSVIRIGNSAFRNWSSNNQPLVIPNSVTSIAELAFFDWTSNNQPLVIPNSVTSIGNNAFRNWSSNNHPLVIGNSVTSIGNYAFFDWTSNNQPLVIPNSVTSIGSNAFYGWTSNNQPLVIPNSVTSIGQTVFYDWSKVPYIEMKSETPPTLSSANAFGGQNDAPIYVPDSAVDAYKNATNWSALSSRIFSINDKP